MSQTSGVVRAAGTMLRGEEAARELQPHLGESPSLVLVFASPKADLQAVCSTLTDLLPGAVVGGCTTMGELGPEYFTEGGVSAFALGPMARAAAVLVDDLQDFEVTDAQEVIHRLSLELGVAIDPARHVLVTLTDGLTGLEELLVASLALAAPQVALVGASAGDDFAFEQTLTAVGKRTTATGAAVFLIEPGVPFMPFRAHNFRATERRMVVTEADPVRRRVFEIDGRPGADVVAEAIGVPVEQLNPRIASEAVFGFGASQHPFLRSVMSAEPDGSLVMGGAVERGAVLTLMQGDELVERTREPLREVIREIGEASGMLLFWCGGRHLEAKDKGLVEAVHDALSPVTSAGFVTYGEHFGAQQINHTLTGLVFGVPQ
ncbi:MAG: hypothetical protein EP330_11510 [Deltaproteobacteria bacterium]|nr:MAG: hypothetical protein EP330_11510 [Deltaproteobacteria bacterium]